ncbi:hypothetical protein NHX12_020903 [Muraenolepis orangiensis]|uniref:Uncharacterized protein n=1 Tax=Muraenolepis orangiensis TaxID=630683 RepID=A0A9Q0EST2_9TELE|nr:hypothetical protein NHX12_020903 [Muraenolepis orangiensis]
MHIKTGTWDGSSSACDPDGLCDPAVLVASAASQPHIRNRRLSPGSGSCGGGGGGCVAGGDRRETPEGDAPYVPAQRRDKERRGLQKGRGQRREGLRTLGRGPQKPPKERWAEDSLALLRPPPAFPVQDSPAKLLPAVSYASKVKAGPAAPDDEPPAIGVLLQNRWGLSFISEAPGPAEATAAAQPPSPPLAREDGCEASASAPVPAVPPEEQNQTKLLMLSYPHLADTLEYHTREWRSISIRQKDSKQVVWYKETLEQPA